MKYMVSVEAEIVKWEMGAAGLQILSPLSSRKEELLRLETNAAPEADPIPSR